MAGKSENVRDMGRAVSVALIRQLHARPVKVLRDQKNPTESFRPDVEMTEGEREALLREIEYSDDNLGIHTHGNVIDIDLDGDSPFLLHAIEAFVPPSSHVWGRKSKPRSHRIYLGKTPFIRSEFTCLSRLKEICKVEIRGGASNMYSVLPGSVHPSGEAYEWSDLARAKTSPAVVEIPLLVKAIRKAAVIDLLAPYWQEGMRNDLTLALSGFLHRCYDMAKDEEDGPLIDLESARVILEVLMDVAGDDSSDKNARLKTLEQTWNKAEKGNVRITGANRIEEITGRPDMARQLYAILTDNPNATEIDQFLTEYCVFKKGGCAIDVQSALRGDTSFMLSKQQLENAEGHRGIMVSGKYHKLASLLFNMKATTRVSGLTLKPGFERFVDVDGRLEFNQWSGFIIEPHHQRQTDDDVKPFLDYILNLVCSGDPEARHWVMAWMADILKNPAEKSGTALVLVGLPGTGKSFLGHSILRPIIGEQHSFGVNDIEHVVANFNMLMDNKIFVQCDEATNSRQRAIAARMKALITEDIMRIEPKGINAYTKPNLIRFLFTSNDEDDAIHLSDGRFDRRYTVLKVSSDKLGDMVYWENLGKWLKDGGLSRVHRYLLDYDYDKKLIRLPYETEAKKIMQASSWDPFDLWLTEWVAREYPISDYVHEHNFYTAIRGEIPDEIDRSEWPDLVSYSALELDYRKFIVGKRGATPVVAQKILQKFREMQIISPEPLSMRPSYKYVDRNQQVRAGRLWLREVPTKGAILDYLQKKYGYVMGLDQADNLVESKETPNETRQPTEY